MKYRQEFYSTVRENKEKVEKEIRDLWTCQKQIGKQKTEIWEKQSEIMQAKWARQEILMFVLGLLLFSPFVSSLVIGGVSIIFPMILEHSLISLIGVSCAIFSGCSIKFISSYGELTGLIKLSSKKIEELKKGLNSDKDKLQSVEKANEYKIGCFWRSLDIYEKLIYMDEHYEVDMQNYSHGEMKKKLEKDFEMDKYCEESEDMIRDWNHRKEFLNYRSINELVINIFLSVIERDTSVQTDSFLKSIVFMDDGNIAKVNGHIIKIYDDNALLLKFKDKLQALGYPLKNVNSEQKKDSIRKASDINCDVSEIEKIIDKYLSAEIDCRNMILGFDEILGEQSKKLVKTYGKN